MGVDSGLPDFRGSEGFWKAYPPLKSLGLNFYDMANPATFESDPALAWGFYGHRLHLYRDTTPHDGFKILKKIAEHKNNDYFVFTSNVDGHFQKSGFQSVVECHGSINYIQKDQQILPADDIHVEVDPSTFRAKNIPKDEFGNVLRPNILMFSDWGWLSYRTDGQQEELDNWIYNIYASPKKLVVVEIGAGMNIPTVRRFAERAADQKKHNGKLIRINLRESQVDQSKGYIGLPDGAFSALQKIDQYYSEML
eukprot:TRINITY_DN23162_c0_g1_i1.p1 TRINITY_DN23162_c0_g1~~TRINITY_DN23162_c0_g1_i1.p1  ORF type:complete len:293 (+),score=74.61 TRINITY_DN23162_c0_g1_i1:124-879(+)